MGWDMRKIFARTTTVSLTKIEAYLVQQRVNPLMYMTVLHSFSEIAPLQMNDILLFIRIENFRRNPNKTSEDPDYRTGTGLINAHSSFLFAS